MGARFSSDQHLALPAFLDAVRRMIGIVVNEASNSVTEVDSRQRTASGKPAYQPEKIKSGRLSKIQGAAIIIGARVGCFDVRRRIEATSSHYAGLGFGVALHKWPIGERCRRTRTKRLVCQGYPNLGVC